MSTLRTIRGLSGAGFRVLDQTSGLLKRVNENNSIVVDVDEIRTQLILAGERDNFIRTKELGTFTVTVASPGVVTKSGHALVNGDIVYLSTTGVLPTGLSAGTKYYVVGAASNTFNLSLTLGGSAINTTGSQSGTHTVTPVSANIMGITTYGIRIKDTTGTLKTVKRGLPGHAVVATNVDLTDGDTKRNLRRSYGRYVYVGSASTTGVTVRGLDGGPKFGTPSQDGFEIDTGGTGTFLSNNTNVSDADTVTVGTQTYTFKTTLSEVKASGTITTSGTGAANNDTVTVGATTYTFKTTLTGAANEVLRTGVEDVDITNLVSAINGSAGAGTTYGTGTVANASVSAAAMASHATVVTALVPGVAGNSIALTKTGSVITVSGAGHLTGGVNPNPNEVHIGGSADASLTNLGEAINAGANVGVDYSTNTPANTDATAGAVSAHTLSLTLVSADAGYDPVVLSTTATTLTAGAFSGGLAKIYRGTQAKVNPTQPRVYTQLRRFYKKWIEV